MTLVSIRLAVRLTWYLQAAYFGIYRAGRGWIVAAPPLALWLWIKFTRVRMHKCLAP